MDDNQPATRGRPPIYELSEADYQAAAARSSRYREAHGLTQTALADLIGATFVQVSNIETGRGDRVSSRVVRAVLDLK